MELSFLEVLLLAVVQGVAEFLPISSSGHLVIVAALLTGGDLQKLDVTELNIVLHLGTLVSILVVYWQRVWRLLGEDRQTIPRLVAGTIPAVVVGLPLKKYADWLLQSPWLAGACLIASGLVLLWIERRPPGTAVYQKLTYRAACGIGVCQALAILPGLSRSGCTIAAGLGANLNRQSAATFSFLLAIPAIAGAGLLEFIDLVGESAAAPANSQRVGLPLWQLGCGAVLSGVVGIVALNWLLRWLQAGRIHLFAWWCIPLGLAVIIWQISLR
jgi:undecaprenyl-diphosphatase